MSSPSATQPQVRRGFGLKEQVKPTLDASYKSPLVERMKAQGYTLKREVLKDGVVKLVATKYG